MCKNSKEGHKRILFFLTRAVFLSLLLTVLACGRDPNQDSSNSDKARSVKPSENTTKLSGSAQNQNSRPHVIFISLDTLRADHLGCYGYSRDSSPFLDQFAHKGVRFHYVISQAPETTPSHMTMFTGLYPSSHATWVKKFNKDEARGEKKIMIPLGNQWQTLPQWFKEAGYHTVAWTGGGMMVGDLGFNRGFDEYHENLKQINSKKMEIILNWFKDHSNQPCFIFIHTYQIHSPYLPPEPYNQIFDPDYNGWIIGDSKKLKSLARQKKIPKRDLYWGRKPKGEDDISQFTPRDLHHLKSLYDGEILYTDKILEIFFNDLANNNLMTNTVVIITSDHGEEFLEHGGFRHSETLYQEVLWVPLIVSYPGFLPEGKVVNSQVRLIDLPPTLLELAGLPIPEQIQGKSLIPLITGKENGNRPAYSEKHYSRTRPACSLRADGYVLYEKGEKKEAKELYDHQNDPGEKIDISRQQPDILSQMVKKAMDFKTSLNTKGSPNIKGIKPTQKQLDTLRSLGYIK